MKTTIPTPDLSKNPQTMSSREIAELAGKRHDNVVRDIEKKMQNSNLRFAVKSSTYQSGNQGRRYKEYLLPRRSCDLLVMGYNDEIQAKVYDRWQELETRLRPPELSEDEIVFKALSIQQEKIKKLESTVEVARECYSELASNLKGGMTVMELGRKLNGVNINQLHGYLLTKGYIVRARGRIPNGDGSMTYCTGYKVNRSSETAKRYFIDDEPATRDTRGGDKSKNHSVKLTADGERWMYSRYIKDELMMLKSWNGSHTPFPKDGIVVPFDGGLAHA